MKKIIIGILTGIVVGFFVVGFFSTNFFDERIPNGYVRVTVENKSGQNIKVLSLIHQYGSIEMKNLNKQESVNLIFKNRGENSYQIFAKLGNDSIIHSRANYVEAGYKEKETILTDRIKTEKDNY